MKQPAKLIHKWPCPRSTFGVQSDYIRWGRICNCPTDWPKYEDDLEAKENGK